MLWRRWDHPRNSTDSKYEQVKDYIRSYGEDGITPGTVLTVSMNKLKIISEVMEKMESPQELY